MEILDIVDSNDQVIGQAERSEIYANKYLHRITHVMVINKSWEIALQLRSKMVSYCPLHWCSTGAWHVTSGESHEQWALRELQEEAWINGALELKDIFLYKNTENINKFISLYILQHEWPFQICPREVEEIKFFTKDEIKNMIQSGEKFHPELIIILQKYFNL